MTTSDWKGNISARCFYGLRLFSHVSVEQRVFDQIFSDNPLKDRESKRFISIYSLGKNKFRVTVTIERLFTKKRITDFHIHMRVSESLRTVKPTRGLNARDVLSGLRSSSVSIDGTVGVRFWYPSKRYNSLVPLPYSANIAPLGNVEIKGLRVNFKEAINGEYSIVIDRPDKEVLYHGVSFKVTKFQFADDCISSLIKRGDVQSKRLVKAKKK